MNSPKTRSLKLQWIEGFQIIICFSFAITLALAPGKIVQMILQSANVSTPVRVLLIASVVIYLLTLARIVAVRLLTSLGFGMQMLGGSRRQMTEHQEAKEAKTA